MVSRVGTEYATQQAMQSQAQNSTYNDVLAIFIHSHGDYDASGPYILLSNGDRIYANELKQMLDNIPCKKRIIILNVCYSGDFISYLRDYKNIIVTSAGHELSSMADNINPDHYDELENEIYFNQYIQSNAISHHEEFNYHFLNAMLQRTPFQPIIRK